MQEVKQSENPNMFEYFRNMREAIILFYEGFVQGLINSGKVEVLELYVTGILTYLMTVTQDEFAPSVSIHISVIGIIGDLANVFGQKVREMFRVTFVFDYLQRFRTHNNLKIRELANWSFNLVNLI